MKSVGPVGNSTIRESLEGDYLFEVPSFQIIPRDFLTGWASDYLRLASFLEGLANFVRLGSRSEINELREGKTGTRQGSSAMPGKENPIDSEKVVGLARIARGYHLALSEVSGSLWEERDLSNSSTERIAVPGLAATVEHMLETMLNVVVHLQINVSNMNRNARDPRCVTNLLQTQEQSKGLDPIAASKKVKEENERRNGS